MGISSSSYEFSKGYVSFEVGKFLLVISVFTDRQLKCRTVTLLDAKTPTPMQIASVGCSRSHSCAHICRGIES